MTDEPREHAEPPGQTEAVREIVRKLDSLPVDRARHVAAFAYMLSRVARADLEVSDEETREMERLVAELGGLPEEQAVIAVHMAKTQNLLFGGTENYLVAKEFKQQTSYEERVALLDCLFAVGASDNSVSTAEDNVIRQIADEIGLERTDVAAARGRYREHLAVLRRRGDDD